MVATVQIAAAEAVALLVKSKIAMEIAALKHGLVMAIATMAPTSGTAMQFT